MQAKPLGPSGLLLIQPEPLRDERGSFERFFCARELGALGFDKAVAQANISSTKKKGTIRGMHFQRPPHAECKLIRCIRGEVLDVAVDLRADSPTFLQWRSVCLSHENRAAVLIPKGFAHGFQTLTDDCEMLYVHSAYYDAGSEQGLRHDDPRLAIDWPLPATCISARDLTHPLITQDFTGIFLI